MNNEHPDRSSATAITSENVTSAPESSDPNELKPSELRAAHGPNPVANSLSVLVSIPESVQITMVDASVLADYEVWFFLSSVLASAVIGFLVAFFQDTSQTAFGWFSVVLAVLLVTSLAQTFSKRRGLKRASRTVRFSASQIHHAAHGREGPE